jgi:hypothetical protein
MRAQSSPDRGGVLGVGVLLVLVGLGAIGLQRAGFAFANVDWEGGWPFLVVVPGLVLFASSFLLSAPRGAGLAIAGSIVTVVGLESTSSVGHARPVAVGSGILIFGVLLIAIGVAGFANEVLRIDWDVLWPLFLVGIGGALVLVTFKR